MVNGSEHLSLKGSSQWDPLDADIVVDSLSKLVNLKDLCLEGICEIFVDQHIVQLASSLLKLEIWSMSGCGLTDAIWSELTPLKSLRRLEFYALASFTVDGILGFVTQLGPGNKGLVISITNVQNGSELAAMWVSEWLIQDMIAQKVGGRFEFEFEKGDTDLKYIS